MNSNKSRIFAQKIRELSLRMVTKAKSSHIGSALSITDILAVLYNDIMKVYPKSPNHPERDIFVLSKGHACVSVYAVLGLKGFFKIEDLESYGMNSSKFMTHISHKVDGVEFSTGSLGHGLPFALGKALAFKLQKKNNNVFVIVGDGELDEGSNWEAILFAAHNSINNLTIIVDYNNLQSLTTVSETMNIEPLTEKFESFGCDVLNVDGHNYSELKKAFLKKHLKPKVIIAKTIKGKGVSFMENKVEWHYKNPTNEELNKALKELNNA